MAVTSPFVLLCTRTQQGSSGALTRLRLPSRAPSGSSVLLNFPTQLLGIGCERLREWSRSRRGGNAALDHRRERR
jgi:hypothetical protein